MQHDTCLHAFVRACVRTVRACVRGVGVLLYTNMGASSLRRKLSHSAGHLSSLYRLLLYNS